MKNLLFIMLLFATGCVLPEIRTTLLTKHVCSQEDSSFYFTDCQIKSRADSFVLLGETSALKYINAANLSKSAEGEVRFTYSRAFHDPYIISLQQGGLVTITTLDTSNYGQYEMKQDTFHFTVAQRNALRINQIYNYYKRHDYMDSAQLVELQNPGVADSLYYDYLRDNKRVPTQDTITLVKTTFHTNPEDFVKIVSLLDKMDFWSANMKEDSQALNGSGWTLEAKAGDKHWIAIRYNVDDKAIKSICRMLLRYTDIKPGDIY